MPIPVYRAPADADRVMISVNPNAGARSGHSVVEQLADALRERNLTVDVMTDVERLGDASAEAHRAGTLRAVVAAGGDGTAAFLLNHTEPGVPITVLPLGTENLLAKYLRLIDGPESVARAIHQGTTVQLDAGRANGRFFLLMFSCGFDADVIRRLHQQRRGHIQHLSYAKPILDAIRSYRYPRIRLYCPREQGSPTESDQEREISAHWAFVFNIPAYATGLTFTPEAVATDGLLNVCTFEGGSFWHGLFYLGAVLMGRHRAWSGCKTRGVPRLRIESDREVPFQLDGDPGGVLPADVEVVPNRLTMVVPTEWARENGFDVER